MKINILKPSNLLPITLLIYLANLIFGPYDFRFYSMEGILYFGFCFFMLQFGIFIGEKKELSNKSVQYLNFTKHDKRLINLAIIIVFISLVISLIYLYFFSGVQSSYSMADIRHFLSRQQDYVIKFWWASFAEFLLAIGPSIFLITYMNRNNSSYFTWVIIILLFIPGIFTLLRGGRNPIFLSFLILFFSLKIKNIKIIQLNKYGIAFISVLFILSYFFVYLFITRAGANTASELTIFTTSFLNPGDAIIKTEYIALSNLTNGIVNPIYYFSFYYSHSLTTFTYIFNNYDSSVHFYGLFALRSVLFITDKLGMDFLPTFLGIVKELPIQGLYSSYISSFLIDWGYFGSPLISLLVGIIFGHIYRLYTQKVILGYIFLPVVLSMIVVSPFYNFIHYGAMDFIIIFTLILYKLIQGVKNENLLLR